MNKNKKYLFLFLCFFILLLLTQKRKLKGGLNICPPNNILNKNNNDNIIDFISSKFQKISKNQLKTQSYENISTIIKKEMKSKSDKTKADIKTIEDAKKSATSYSFTKDIDDYKGGMYTLCESNNDISLKKYDKIFALANTEILSQKKLENKLAKLKSSGSSGMSKEAFQKQLQYYLTPKTERGNQMQFNTKGSILARGKKSGYTIYNDINDYKRWFNRNEDKKHSDDNTYIKKKPDAPIQTEKLNLLNTNQLLNFVFFDWKVGAKLTAKEKMKILAASYYYLFQKLPVITFQTGSGWFRTNIGFYKKCVYKGVENIKTRSFDGKSTITRKCVSFDLKDYGPADADKRVGAKILAGWLGTAEDQSNYSNKNLIQFYDDTKLKNEIDNIHRDLGFVFMVQGATNASYLFISLGFPISTDHKIYKKTGSKGEGPSVGTDGIGDTRGVQWLRLGNCVFPKNASYSGMIYNDRAGIVYFMTRAVHPEIVVNDTFSTPDTKTST